MGFETPFLAREGNQEITRQDMQNDAVQVRIQAFMDSRGFPQLWVDEEYTTYFEKIFGTDRERQRAYLRGILSDAHRFLEQTAARTAAGCRHQ